MFCNRSKFSINALLVQVLAGGYHKNMFTFRYNPVFRQWVILGKPSAANPLKPTHFLDVGKSDDFTAAAYPRDCFIIEPPSKPHSKFGDSENLVFASQPPVGEYELLLYKGDEEPFFWKTALWSRWLALIQQRIRQIHHNPYLHYLHFTLSTSALTSVPSYLRVGDLIATSHPVCGTNPVLDVELADKLRQKENIFTVVDSGYGCLHVPSAPLYNKEVWYVPQIYRSGFEQIESKERERLAKVLTVLLRRLHLNYPDDHYVINIHSALAAPELESTWWLQIYKEDLNALPLTVRALPENFVQALHTMLKD